MFSVLWSPWLLHLQCAEEHVLWAFIFSFLFFSWPWRRGEPRQDNSEKQKESRGGTGLETLPESAPCRAVSNVRDSISGRDEVFSHARSLSDRKVSFSLLAGCSAHSLPRIFWFPSSFPCNVFFSFFFYFLHCASSSHLAGTS